MGDSDVAMLERAARNGHLAHQNITPEQFELVRRTVAKGATDDELALYFHDCQRRGVHPLDRMLHFTIRTDKHGVRRYTPITSIDFLRSQAAGTGELAGMDDATYQTEPDGRVPMAATITVYRLVQGHRCPTTKTARWFEYKPAKDDFMWQKMPFTMLAKCAEALALRAAFPQQLAGLYTHDEMAQAGPAVDPDMTLEANSLSGPEQAAARRANPQPPKKVYCDQNQYDRLRDLGDELDLSPEERLQLIAPYGVKRGRSLTPEQCDEVCTNLARHLAVKLLSLAGWGMGDVQERCQVAADTPEELTLDEADKVIRLLREVISQEGQK